MLFYLDEFRYYDKLHKKDCKSMQKRFLLILLMICGLAVNLYARPKIGLVLSGGGAKGLAHIGMLRVIEETKLPIDCIVGTSMGAIIGGLYAMGYSANEIEQAILQVDWDNLMDDEVSREDIYVGQKRWFPNANYYFNLDNRFNPSLPQGFIIGNNIHLKLNELTWKAAHIHDFNKLKIPFRCVGTSLLTGKSIIFDSGSLADAMRASSSLPSLFMPFEYNNDLIIDGGISQNLPIDIAKAMGMDIVIGLKANTKLQNGDNLKDAISVLSQTINIGMTKSIENSIQKADIIIDPAVDSYSASDFKHARDIITIGEIEASRYFTVFDSLANYIKAQDFDSLRTPEAEYKMDNLPDSISFNWINVENNQYLHANKVREYLSLEPNKLYSKEEILQAFYNAWASELFDQIYPMISKTDSYYVLTIIVKEKERKKLGINLSYNDYNGMIAGASLDFNNVIQKNSKLLVSAQIGGKHELDIDYVKNFGKHYGVYFRLFPNIKEDRIFIFNDEHEKIMSMKYLEYGGTFGVGFYSFYNNIIEPYLYCYNINIYKDIANYDIEKLNAYSTGLGIKYYNEKIDDLTFPMKGHRLMAKYNQAWDNQYSQYAYKKLSVENEGIIPINNKTSFILKVEYGTYLETDPVRVDPFFIGGIDSFLGLSSNEISTPFYRIARTALRVNFKKNYYADAVFNYFTWGNTDIWPTMDKKLAGGGLILGYKSMFGPLRFSVALDSKKHFNSYVSIGYDYDAFAFSRR